MSVKPVKVVAEPSATKKSAQIRVYEPGGGGLLERGVWREMVLELVRSRELIWRLFVRDLIARYKQSVLGVLWAFLPPVATTVMFTFLNGEGIIVVEDTEIPYPAYVFLSISLWQLFASGLALTTGSLTAAGRMIVKINFPREVLVISALGQAVFEFLIRVILVAVVFAWFGVRPSWGALMAIGPLALLLMLTLALGLGLSILNGVMRDVGQAVPMLTTLLMFLTPVIYPPVAVERVSLLNLVNPTAPLLNAARDLILHGTVRSPAELTIAGIVSVVLLAVSWRVFHMAEPMIAERI